eukprot:m.78505 g.78505  ORF g.78505 m.78505 type:complete len:315 (-) comp11958_c0_seq1:215-1159(-)
MSCRGLSTTTVVSMMTLGTGAVALAGMLSAMRITNKSIKDMKIVCVGAGSAGVGVCRMLMKEFEMKGVTRNRARQHFWMLDVKGLLTRRREVEGQQVNPGADIFLRRDEEYVDMEGASLKEVVEKVKPDLILGLAGRGGLFTEDVIKTMASHVDRPIIFAMSNPTKNAECTAEQAYKWTDGRAVFASGSPFDAVDLTTSSGPKSLQCSQANNMYIFPGLGLGVISCKAKTVSDGMIYQAAKTLANYTSRADLNEGKVYPPITEIRKVSRDIAIAVCRVAEQEGIAGVVPPHGDWESIVGKNMWNPHYPDLLYLT